MSKKTTNSLRKQVELALREGRKIKAEWGGIKALVWATADGWIMKQHTDSTGISHDFNTVPDTLRAMETFLPIEGDNWHFEPRPVERPTQVIALDIGTSNTRNIIGKTSAVEREEIVEVRKTRTGKRGVEQ